MNLCFPGQYADSETGLFYNYFRTYDPKSGRYTQNDPIGLAGGWNRMGFVEGNPLGFTDPEGLKTASGGRGGQGMQVPPPNYPICEKDGKCESTITVKTSGVCESGDTMCVISIRAAGMQGPYYNEYKKYDWKCLLKLGLAGKVGGTVAGNAAANQVPSIAQADGAGAKTMGVVNGGVAVFTHPVTTAVGITVGLALVLKECECNN